MSVTGRAKIFVCVLCWWPPLTCTAAWAGLVLPGRARQQTMGAIKDRNASSPKAAARSPALGCRGGFPCLGPREGT